MMQLEKYSYFLIAELFGYIVVARTHCVTLITYMNYKV
jgi:hypothetical protein